MSRDTACSGKVLLISRRNILRVVQLTKFLLAVPYGSVWDHILVFWKMRHEPNVLFNTFEEMKKVTSSTYLSRYSYNNLLV